MIWSARSAYISVENTPGMAGTMTNGMSENTFEMFLSVFLHQIKKVSCRNIITRVFITYIVVVMEVVACFHGGFVILEKKLSKAQRTRPRVEFKSQVLTQILIKLPF